MFEVDPLAGFFSVLEYGIHTPHIILHLWTDILSTFLSM